VLDGEPHGKIPLDCKAATHTSCSDHGGRLQQNVLIIQKLQEQTFQFKLIFICWALQYCAPLYPQVLADLDTILKIHAN